MRSREEIYNKLIEMNKHKDELAHFLNNPPYKGLWGISEKREQFNQQCSMIDLMEWVLDIKDEEDIKYVKENIMKGLKINQNKDDER